MAIVVQSSCSQMGVNNIYLSGSWLLLLLLSFWVFFLIWSQQLKEYVELLACLNEKKNVYHWTMCLCCSCNRALPSGNNQCYLLGYTDGADLHPNSTPH